MNRIYVACLASYNNGVLHGKWIDATSDVDAMQEEVNAILRSSRFPNVTVEFEGEQVPSAEEWAIHDHEGEALDGLKEYSGLKEVARRIEIEELAESEIDNEGPAIVRAYWDNMGAEPDDASEAVEEARENYCGSFDNWTAWAENWLDDCGMLSELPEWAKNYFDFEAYGRDARLNGDIFESGGHFFHSR